MAGEVRAYDVSAHEAAHVVVGCALGLRLRHARVGDHQDRGVWYEGEAWFRGGARRREGHAIMLAAGVAWDQAIGAPRESYSSDLAGVRELTSGRHGVTVCVAAAAAVLAARGPLHARVTRVLLAGDITGRDLAAICRGEWPDD